MANPNPKLPPIHSRFKKGQSGNPLGGKMHDPALRALRKMSKELYAEIVHMLMTSTLEEIKKAGEDPKTIAAKRFVCIAFAKAMQRGDYSTFRTILSEVIGKVPDEVKHKIEADIQNANTLKIDEASVSAIIDKFKNEY